MTEAAVLELTNSALTVMLMLAGPMLAVVLATGLVVSIFQASTQIHEMTLTFVPKMAAVFLVLVVTGPWMLSTLLSYTANIFMSLPTLGR